VKVPSQEEERMREVSNCLNTFLVLLTLPLYLLAPMAALAGTVIGAFAPTWLPDWLQFITTRTFLFVAVGLFVWFWIVTFIAGIRTGPAMDAIGVVGIAFPRMAYRATCCWPACWWLVLCSNG
jgi:uncharacterized membrane protein (DUF485 family)